jgi:hypothetical protein
MKRTRGQGEWETRGHRDKEAPGAPGAEGEKPLTTNH